MKGKHTNAADRRRHLEDLTARAETAERKAEKLAAELTDLRVTSERQIGDLRSQVTELKRQRDEAVSPELKTAAEQVEKLRRRISELKSYEAGAAQAHKLMLGEFVNALTNRGIPSAEVTGIVARARQKLTDADLDQVTFLSLAADKETLGYSLTKEAQR